MERYGYIDIKSISCDTNETDWICWSLVTEQSTLLNLLWSFVLPVFVHTMFPIDYTIFLFYSCFIFTVHLKYFIYFVLLSCLVPLMLAVCHLVGIVSVFLSIYLELKLSVGLPPTLTLHSASILIMTLTLCQIHMEHRSSHSNLKIHNTRRHQ